MQAWYITSETTLTEISDAINRPGSGVEVGLAQEVVGVKTSKLRLIRALSRER